MSARGRGRRDNGLDAALWIPLRDVDPRVGEHLLDVLREAGVAAYLEPSADVEPYTRSVSLPSPPSDRLFVDRACSGQARALVDEHADDHVAERTRARSTARREIDEDAEWARIVAAFEAEHGRTVVEEEPAGAAPPPAEPSVLDRPEEHYEPPPPPPVPAPAPASLYAVLLIAAGAVLVVAPRVLGLSLDLGLVLGVAAVAGGVGVLLSRMRERGTDDDDGDDGAVV